MTDLPTLPGLEAFEAAARHGSFTRAAEELHVTQSAISHRIKALETQLGCALFARRGRQLELTEEGRALASAARDAFARLREGVDRLRTRQGALTLSCSPSFAIRWLVPNLPDFARAHPDVSVRLAAEDRLTAPGQGGIDACLRYGAGSYPGVAHTRLRVEEIFPVCSPSLLPLARPSDLRGHTLLHDEVLRAHAGRVGWRRWLEAAGVEGVDPDRGPRFSHAHMALDAAVAGQGVALGRTTLVARDLEDGRLVRPFTLGLESGLSYWLLTPEGDPPPRVARFRDWLLRRVSA
ncbi:MAG: transcriptional regulator GcvA [Myxococcota bacterium]|nr:transcriptional regulator GcvA [Myxococcota bacterium]